MREDARQRATEFVKELYATGEIDADRFGTGVAGVLAATGSITIIVPAGVDVQVIRHRGGVDSRLDPPVPGLPLIRLDVTTNIGRVHLRHPGARDRNAGGR
jgi:hypothetical protein